MAKHFKATGKDKESWIVWLMSVILEVGIWRKENPEFKVIP